MASFDDNTVWDVVESSLEATLGEDVKVTGVAAAGGDARLRRLANEGVVVAYEIQRVVPQGGSPGSVFADIEESIQDNLAEDGGAAFAAVLTSEASQSGVTALEEVTVTDVVVPVSYVSYTSTVSPTAQPTTTVRDFEVAEDDNDGIGRVQCPVAAVTMFVAAVVALVV